MAKWLTGLPEDDIRTTLDTLDALAAGLAVELDN
jgi:hypothetical protein